MYVYISAMKFAANWVERSGFSMLKARALLLVVEVVLALSSTLYNYCGVNYSRVCRSVRMGGRQSVGCSASCFTTGIH